MARRQLRTLLEAVSERFPGLADPATAIETGQVLVNGIPVRNRASRVRPGSSVALRPGQALRGSLKLEAALARFPIPLSGSVALDLGAAAGGFTQALLAHGAARVYAVDVGHGQLLGSLRQDPRVVNLEATNLSELTPQLVPEPAAVVTADLSNLALALALPQLDVRILAAQAHLVALVKPMFELGLARLPTSPGQLEEAVRRAEEGAERSGWRVLGSIPSPVPGAGGAAEFFLHAERRG